MVWSDQGGSGVPSKVTMCLMDGSGLTNIATGNLGGIQHVAIDGDTHFVYWTDQEHGVVIYINFSNLRLY